MIKTILISTSSFGKFSNEPLNLLKETFEKVVFNPYGRKLTEKEILVLIREHQPVGIIAGVEPLTKNVLQVADHLKIISRAGIGVDNIDLNEAKKLNIAVTNTPDAPTIPVAELTVGMMLSLLRKIHQSDQAIRMGVWDRPMGELLNGKTVGLIGCGRIGQTVSKILAAFGCNIFGCDPVCCKNKIISFLQFEELLKSSDIVSLHVPYSKETRHIINAKTIALMKNDAYLINASRGGLVDEEALYNALQNGSLSGAALDSFEEEPYRGPLTKLDNVLLTSHIGSYAKEGRIAMEKHAVENLLSELHKAGVT